MKLRHQVMLGLAGGAALSWGARAWLRSRRRIELAGRVVLVTGGSAGLGLMIARQAAEAGARLVLAARGEEDLRLAEAELRGLGAEVLAVPTDVSDEGQVRNLVARAIERFGKVDVLVNNAGTIQVGPAESMTVDDFRQAMAINYWGELLPTLALLPHMKTQGGGRIANVVSVGGKVSVPHLLPYCASKFALTGLTQGLRAELAKDNILVTGIYPGTIRTGGHTHAQFKGDHEAEYTWFALSDTIPGVSTSAESAARQPLAGRPGRRPRSGDRLERPAGDPDPPPVPRVDGRGVRPDQPRDAVRRPLARAGHQGGATARQGPRDPQSDGPPGARPKPA